ncbi:MAG: hypothetical protein U9N54_02450 [candidate division Zixibacteria bacterium]|nr:hypothetical protein [candidate division Zixibacteria bacterium]
MDIGTIVAGILTLAILSFLYRDNPVYKMAESLLLGVAIGYQLVIVWSTTLVDLLFKPLFGNMELGLIIPFILGLLMLARMNSKTSLLSKIPIGVMIGSGAGLAFPVMLEQRILKQMSATVMPVVTENGFPDFTAIIVIIGVLSTLTYFYFSREHKGIIGKVSKIGTYFLMIFFGATFGYTVMSRMSTFIGRIDFLLTDFLHILN